MRTLDVVSLLQSVILALLMLVISVYYKNKNLIKMYNLQNSFLIFSVGIILGVISAFLGIGGGPFNVAVLTLGFSMNSKNASINSLFIIFFSQIASLLTTQATTGYGPFKLDLLPYIILGGVVGGLIGSNLLSKINHKGVEGFFTIVVLLILILNIFNVVRMTIYVI